MPRMSKQLKKELAFFQRKFISVYDWGRSIKKKCWNTR